MSCARPPWPCTGGHVTRPDVDKLARAALDAITNIWIDDHDTDRSRR